MSDTTSILELPTDPAGPVNQNISLVASEINTAQPANNSKPLTLDQNTISQIVSGLQQASVTGVTQLPSRDIPRTTEAITQDPQVQPNYVPQDTNNQQPKDYIQNDEDMETMIQKYNKQMQKNDTLDDIYSEIQNPLLLSVLYFIFQLPVFKKFLYQYFSVLFSKDGNYNINGYLFTSILFSLMFYFVTKITLFFNTF
jgi:hypothetical protein